MERPIYIPEPCHVSWKKMTPQEQGRHCAVCDKVVVDFSKKTKAEISNYLDENADQKVCGRFGVNQLDQQAQMKVFRKPSNFFNKNWKFAFMAFLGLFAISRKAEAQGKIRGRVSRPLGGVKFVDYPLNPENKTTRIISGHVSSYDREHVQDVSVDVYQGEKLIAQATTHANGRFLFKLDPGSLKGNKIKIIATHDEYLQRTLEEIVLVKDTTKLEISLTERYMLKGEVAFPEEIYPVQGKVEYIPDPVTEEPDTIVTCQNLIPDVDTVITEPLIDITEITPDEVKALSEIIPVPVEAEDLEMNLFPNPANTYAILETENEDAFDYVIYDMSGALIVRGRSNGRRLTIDVGAWTPATYICIAREGERAKSMKLVISR